RENMTMATRTKRLALAVLACAAGCLLTANSVLAQPAPAPNTGLGTGNVPAPLLSGFNAQAQGLGFAAGLPQRAFMTSVTTPYPPSQGATGLSPVGTTPFSGTSYPSAYGSGYSGYYYDSNAIGETLRGLASAINAEGTYLMQVQDARIRYEQWQQARLDT